MAVYIAGLKMKINTQILKLARKELDRHFLIDLAFTEELHRFMNNAISIEEFLHSPYGFKKFIADYGVVRTLKAGDEAKAQIVATIKDFSFSSSHIETIVSLALALKQQELSSKSAAGGCGLPRSFVSKLLYVYKPDEIIPFDSYVGKSLEIRTGRSLKELHPYYQEAENFRQKYFPESGAEIKRLREKYHTHLQPAAKKFKLNPDKLLSWKITDKYLWCEEWQNKAQL